MYNNSPRNTQIDHNAALLNVQNITSDSKQSTVQIAVFLKVRHCAKLGSSSKVQWERSSCVHCFQWISSRTKVFTALLVVLLLHRLLIRLEIMLYVSNLPTFQSRLCSKYVQGVPKSGRKVSACFTWYLEIRWMEFTIVGWGTKMEFSNPCLTLHDHLLLSLYNLARIFFSYIVQPGLSSSASSSPYSVFCYFKEQMGVEYTFDLINHHRKNSARVRLGEHLGQATGQSLSIMLFCWCLFK